MRTKVKGHKITIHFEEKDGKYFFNFQGQEFTISQTGLHSECVSDRALVRRKYLNPGVWADFKAEKLYCDYQRSRSTTTRKKEESISPLSNPAFFTVTVGESISVKVEFHPLEDGERHLLKFKGPIARSGKREYYVFPSEIGEFSSPLMLAQKLASNFHEQWKTANPDRKNEKIVTKNGISTPAVDGKQSPTNLKEVRSASDIDALIDIIGIASVCRMYVSAPASLQRLVRSFYPGIGALVTSELGGSELNKIALDAGFLPLVETASIGRASPGRVALVA